MTSKRDSAANIRLSPMSTEESRGDAGSFDTFLREQHRNLVTFLRRRTASEQDAEDAAQESMTKLLRYRDTEPASAWKQLLYRIAVNVAHDQFRVSLTRFSKDHVTLDGQDIVDTERSPEERMSYEQQVARLSKAILELPPKCQKVYLLKRVHGLSRAQIAEKCGISVKMVEKHLATALVLLKRKVGDSPAGTFE
ncbi:RNA polymerase sigma factor [Dyella sp.]|uniref:RNA polymerase sigma factor n=1 Tax=Dyella sp. TaxID=1869338 RepID=UPI002ED1343B